MVNTLVGISLDFRGFVSNGDQEPMLLLQGNGRFMNLKLRYLRFVIEAAPTSSSELMDSTTIVATVLPIIGVMMTLLLIVSVILFAIRRQKRRKKIMINMNRLATEQEGINNGKGYYIY